MGNDVKFPKLNIFLEVVEMYVRMFYVIALIYPVGGYAIRGLAIKVSCTSMIID